MVNNNISLQLAEKIVKILNNKQASNITMYDVSETSSITDYYIICNGRGTTHVKSLGDELEFQLKNLGIEIRGIEGRDEGTWILIDCYQVIVHVFEKQTREFFNVERLQKEEQKVDISSLLEDEN